MNTDSCKHKHITLTASVYYVQTHLPNPALSSALFRPASGFKNKWRAWPFIMFRTLFFLRLECGQECVVALLTLTYQAIMLQKKRREMQEDRRWRSIKKGEKSSSAQNTKKQPITITSNLRGGSELSSAWLRLWWEFHCFPLSASGFHYSCYDALCSGQDNTCITACLLLGCLPLPATLSFKCTLKYLYFTRISIKSSERSTLNR